jgi:hypothetical protein
VCGGDGGVLLGASLGSAIAGARPRGETDPAAQVKPYVRRNKNDAADAAAICEAAGRPGQRFVPVRTIDNQAELMRHRARELLAGQRTAALNALRGHLAEIGIVAPQGVQHAYDLKCLAVDGFDECGQRRFVASHRMTGVDVLRTWQSGLGRLSWAGSGHLHLIFLHDKLPIARASR